MGGWMVSGGEEETVNEGQRHITAGLPSRLRRY